MQRQKKENKKAENFEIRLRAAALSALRYFAVYALLPLLCGAFIALFLTIKSFGASETLAIAEEYGKKSLFYAAASAEESERESGFYFLTKELPLFIKTASPVLYGGAVYYNPPEEASVPAIEETEPTPDDRILYEAVPANAAPIVRCDLSSNSFFINTTKYNIDIPAARSGAFPSGTATQNGEPLVLVLHTHGTEGYFEDQTNLSDFAEGDVESFFREGEDSFRTTDPTKSVVQVGKVFSETLISEGVPTLHCTIMHDANDFNDAYVYAAETIKSYLNQYPSIQYVVDLHRDSIMRGDNYVKSFTTVDGKPSAQVMLVVGTNQLGRHPNWEQNLIVTTALKDKMDSLYPSLSRSLYIRTARFNQEYRPGSMLLEVGSAANTLEEAENAARGAALSFAAMLRDKG